jgi:uncharacterized protein YegL
MAVDEMLSGFSNVQFNNFDPANVATDDVILVTLVIDKSGSVGAFVHDLDIVLNDFVDEISKSHVSDKVLVQTLLFNNTVEVAHGFKPITEMAKFDIQTRGTTALFDATRFALANATNYKNDLSQQGLTAKSLVFILTDGDDNASTSKPSDIAAILNSIYTNEQFANEFTIMAFGLGNEADFAKIFTSMGIKPELIAKVGVDAKSLRSMIGFISSSVSSSGSGSVPTSVSF